MRRTTLLALSTAVLITFVALLTVVASPSTAALGETRRVTAPPGILDGSQPGIERLHDYGSFALYRVEQRHLDGLTEANRSRVQQVDDRILIDAYPFDTQRDGLDLPPSLTALPTEAGSLHLVQFVGPIKEEWLARLRASGATPVHYIANNGYLVWADGVARARLDQMVGTGEFLQYRGLYHPYFKLGPSLRAHFESGDVANHLKTVTVQIYDHPDAGATQALLRALAVEEQSGWSAIPPYRNIRVTLPAREIERVATRPDVTWVNEWVAPELYDEVQNQIIAGNLNGSQSGPSGTGYLAWLAGRGLSTTAADYPIVDITDDGIGNGTVTSGDPTLHVGGASGSASRLAFVGNCTAEANGGGLDGHGHINTSIVGGYDARAGFPFQDPLGFQRGMGVNPYGRIAGTRVFNSAGSFDASACSNTYNALVLSSYSSGARISSNSWGCSPCAGSYDGSSQVYDFLTRDADSGTAGSQPFFFVFSAGNSGSGAATIGTPGNGKNMLTVGASENFRPSDEDGSWTDGCAISPTGANNAMDVISFSSRGPAPGSRVKPEIIAPGTHIQGTASTHASYTGTGVCDQYHPSGQTTFAASSGTSHSAPAVSGVASLYWYWLETTHGITTPSPAMLKAYILAHTTYLTGVSANDNYPSNNQGYGMPHMGKGFDDSERHLVDQTVIFDNTGETWGWSGQVDNVGREVVMVLTYSDMFGMTGTSPQVNNLNLSAIVNGTTYLGNNFSGQYSTSGGSADSANNYEAIRLPAGTTGAISVTVSAANIAGNGVPNVGDGTDQDFALVCYNCDDTPLAVTLSAFGAVGRADHIQIDWETVSEIDNLGFNLYRSTSPGQLGEALNDALIPSQAPGTGLGALYGWRDRSAAPETTYYYTLESVATGGAIERYGPVSARLTPPTAIGLAELAVEPPGAPALWLAVLPLLLVAATLARRRRVA